MILAAYWDEEDKCWPSLVPGSFPFFFSFKMSVVVDWKASSKEFSDNISLFSRWMSTNVRPNPKSSEVVHVTISPATYRIDHLHIRLHTICIKEHFSSFAGWKIWTIMGTVKITNILVFTIVFCIFCTVVFLCYVVLCEAYCVFCNMFVKIVYVLQCCVVSQDFSVVLGFLPVSLCVLQYFSVLILCFL